MCLCSVGKFQGACWPLVESILECTGTKRGASESLCDYGALRDYLLACCQGKHGGMLDKPGRNPDFYHTCYALSGLATLQKQRNGEDVDCLESNHPLLNVSFNAEQKARSYFAKK